MEKTSVRGIFEMSKLGFGAWAIGGGSYGGVKKEDAFGALDAYLATGGNMIDTAQGYAESERIIGEYLKEKGITNDMIIATKSFAGSSMENMHEIEIALNESLEKLQRDYVDIFYLHNPPEENEIIDEALSILEAFKKEGKIRAIGASIKGVDVTDDTVKVSKQYIDTGRVDVIQLVYSIFRQKNSEIFAYAKEHKVAIVGRTSLESGFLTGKFQKGYAFSKGDHRARWNDNKEYIIDQAIKLNETMKESAWDSDLLSLALRFAIKPDSVTSTIVGAKNKQQMQGLITAFEKGAISDEIEDHLIASHFALNNTFNTKNISI